MRILFFIGTLSAGGAERQLSILAKELSGRGHKIIVATLFSGGQIADELKREASIELIPLWARKSQNYIFRFCQLATAPFILRKLVTTTDCVYSMLEITNFFAWLATRFKRNTKLIWGIRSSSIDGHWKIAIFDKLCILVSSSVKMLISNSEAGLEGILKRGYRPQQYIVIHNGIDTSRFQYSVESRKKLRSELGVSFGQPLVGIVARLDPLKDHPTFLKAAALLVKEIDNVKFLCVGEGKESYAVELYALVKKLGLTGRVIWLTNQSDMVSIYSTLDILVSSSCGEGFSNVIGEAMSCGLPCIVTDVGDSAYIVGDRARVVEPRNVEMLAQAIKNTYRKKANTKLAEMSRIRIEEKFTIKKMTDLTEMVLRRN